MSLFVCIYVPSLAGGNKMPITHLKTTDDMKINLVLGLDSSSILQLILLLITPNYLGATLPVCPRA